jgi:hypothetical protein
VPIGTPVTPVQFAGRATTAASSGAIGTGDQVIFIKVTNF